MNSKDSELTITDIGRLDNFVNDSNKDMIIDYICELKKENNGQLVIIIIILIM